MAKKEEIVVEENLSDEFVDEKDKKKSKNIILSIFNFILTIVKRRYYT